MTARLNGSLAYVPAKRKKCTVDLDALERLAKLRDSGTISEAEFIEQKRLLTKKTSSPHKHMPSLRTLLLSPNNRPKVIGAGAIVVASLGALFIAFSGGLIGGGPRSISPFGSPFEQQCKASITSTLINPETAEFFEFSPSTPSSYIVEFEREFRESLESAVSEMNLGSGLYGVYAESMASSTDLIISRRVSEAVSAERTRLSAPNIKTFSYRMKADGRLGNTITSTQYCVVDANSCSCIG